MNIHLPAILMFTRGTRFWPTAIWWIWSWWSIKQWDVGHMGYIAGMGWLWDMIDMIMTDHGCAHSGWCQFQRAGKPWEYWDTGMELGRIMAKNRSNTPWESMGFRVFPMVFPGISHGFPMVFPWISDVQSMVTSSDPRHWQLQGDRCGGCGLGMICRLEPRRDENGPVKSMDL